MAISSNVTTGLIGVVSASVAVMPVGAIDGEGSTAAAAAVRFAGACLRVRTGAAPLETMGSEAVVLFLGIIPVIDPFADLILMALFYQNLPANSKKTFYRTYNASVFPDTEVLGHPLY